MTDPATLYHYTDAAGVLGIVSKLSLWYTDLGFLNDARELVYAQNEIVARLTKAADDMEAGATADDYARGVGAQITLLRTTAKSTHTATDLHQIFVACFCGNGDLLSQWRAYGRSDGYAIGFDPTKLLQSGSVSLKLRPIVYGWDAVEQDIEDAVRAIAAHPPMGHPGSRGQVMFDTKFLDRCIYVKDPAFAEEAEWRASTDRLTWDKAGPEIQFRTSQLGLVPYLQLPFPADSLIEIVVGPGRHPDLRCDGVLKLLRSRGREDVTVSVAPIAYTFR